LRKDPRFPSVLPLRPCFRIIKPSFGGTLCRLLAASFSHSSFLFFGTGVGLRAGQNAGAIRGTVTDPSGAVIPGATVHLTNPAAAWTVRSTSDALGQFEFRQRHL
jgi:hypothetical protein